MFVLSPIVVVVMMVHVSDPPGLRKVGSNVLLVLEGVLDMGADQRNNAGRLGQQKEPQEQRAKTPQLSQ